MANKATKRPVIGITTEEEGEYFRLRNHYPKAIVRACGVPVLIAAGSDPASAVRIIDALLVPGGDDIDPSLYSEEIRPATKIVRRERTDFEIGLLEAIMKQGKPVFGICYGMQLINVALGGSLHQDIGSQFGGIVDHRKGSHRIRGKGALLNGEFVVNTSHHQAVKKLGEGIEALAVSDDDLVEAITLPGYCFLVAVQWHPERSNDALSRNLFRSFVDAADECK